MGHTPRGRAVGASISNDAKKRRPEHARAHNYSVGFVVYFCLRRRSRPRYAQVIFLGPDEQVIPDDINWMVKRAATRGYPCAPAFMSSKPDAGINHKEFGVTSEGVVVFLESALRSMGIEPRGAGATPFTVKLTGGPDGDVAGNAIRILYREFGTDIVKVVGVADASGCAEDPNGLDADELMRLVDGERPIGEVR